MRLLTKADACRTLGVSLSTLDRRIASGEILTQREPRGRRHRVYVVLGDHVSEGSDDAARAATVLAVAHERIRGLEEQVALLRELLDIEQRRCAELLEDLKVDLEDERHGPKFRLW